MAFENRNAAYDIEQFDDYDIKEWSKPKSPAKENTVKNKNTNQNTYKDTEQNAEQKVVPFPTKADTKATKHKIGYKKVASVITVSSLIIICLIANIGGRVALTEVNQKINKVTKELTQQESIYTQNKLRVETKYSTIVVEEYAKKHLNMSRSNNYQREYINLSEGDKVEIAPIEEENIFEKMFASIKALLS